MLSLTGGGENCQLAAMSKARVHPHDDTAPDWTHQQALPEIAHKHGDRLLLCCTCQLSPKERECGIETERDGERGEEVSYIGKVKIKRRGKKTTREFGHSVN